MPFGGVGMGEMVLIFLVVLLLFGAKRLPEIGSSLGKGIREFKSSVRDIESELKTGDRARQTPPPPREAEKRIEGSSVSSASAPESAPVKSEVKSETAAAGNSQS